MNVRAIALKLLCEHEDNGTYINLALNSHHTDSLSRDERAFLTALLYGVVEKKITFDYYISALSARSIDKIDTVTKNILRLGMMQILCMDKVPDFAAVNESVALSKNSGARAFVNAILRKLLRTRDTLPLPDRAKNAARYLSVKYSFPQKTVKEFISLYGEAGACALLERYCEIPPTDLTVNITKISREEFIEKLSKIGIAATPSPYSNISVRIEGSVDPTQIDGYDTGEFFVQDAACAAAISALSPQENDRIADVCSAPGGKSFAAAVLCRAKGEIYSFDLYESKISLIESGARRLSFDIIKAEPRDALTPKDELLYSCDRVICDVPCSGLGVLAKKPDLKYRDFSSSDLPEIQLSILCESSKYLKVGGVLIYSTCTLRKEENECVVSAFLDSHSDYSSLDFNVGEYKSQDGMFTFIPHVHKTDGFFIALIRRNK